MTRALTLSAAQQSVVQRGRMLTVDHILALLPEKRSRWWGLNRFLPEHRQKLGKMVYWWESDVRPVLFVPDVLPVVRRGQAA
jgi:hypothetical protein